MKNSALLQTPSNTRSGDTTPAARSAGSLRTLLFEDRVPELAQAQWHALRSNAPWMETLLQKALRARQLCTYALQDDGRTIALYFFRRQKSKITVLNADTAESGQSLFRFTRFIFDRYPQISEISFQGSQRYIHRPSRLRGKSRQRIILPPHPSAQMDEALRFSKRSVNYFLQRLKRDFSSPRFELHAGEALDESLCRSILHLPRPRLAGDAHDDLPLTGMQENLVHAVKSGGLAVTLSIEGKLAAGVILQRVGSDMHLRFLAHDPRLQAYGLGMLCCYVAACAHMHGDGTKSQRLLSKPRYRFDLEVQEQRFTAMRIFRPHASWLVRADVAVYYWANRNLERYLRFRDDCVQLGEALARLASAWRLGYQALRNWRSRPPFTFPVKGKVGMGMGFHR